MEAPIIVENFPLHNFPIEVEEVSGFWEFSEFCGISTDIKYLLEDPFREISKIIPHGFGSYS